MAINYTKPEAKKFDLMDLHGKVITGSGLNVNSFELFFDDNTAIEVQGEVDGDTVYTRLDVRVSYRDMPPDPSDAQAIAIDVLNTLMPDLEDKGGRRVAGQWLRIFKDGAIEYFVFPDGHVEEGD